MRVVGLVHANGGHAKAEEAGVVASQLRRVHIGIEHIRADQIANLWMRDAGRTAADAKNGLDVGIEEALPEHALPDHPGCAKEDYLHLFPCSGHDVRDDHKGVSA